MVSELALEAIEQIRGQAANRPVKLILEMPDSVQPLTADSIRLKQVILNLLSNAVKFTGEGSVTARLKTDDRGHPIYLDITDTGIGIPAVHLQTIFEPFHQGGAEVARKYGGTGLGLSISRSLLYKMGFGLEVKSQLGQGSTFRIIFGSQTPKHPVQDVIPKAKAAAALPPQELASNRPDWKENLQTAERTVLIIDDEEDSRMLLRHIIEELGYSAVEAASAQEGLEKALRLSPRLITLDLKMPEVDGWEALRRLKSNPQLKDVPVVIVSISEPGGRAVMLGAIDNLEKPVTREQLQEVIGKVLEDKGVKV